MRKKESLTGVQPLLAESIAWLMAQRADMRTPEAAFHVDRSGEYSWLSKFIYSNKLWRPENGDFIANLDDVAGMLVLDAVLLNEDRHGSNIVLEAREDGVSFTAWPIDFGNALVGWVSDFSSRALGAPQVDAVRRQHVRGLPLEAIEPYLAEPLDRLRRLSASDIVGITCEACRIAREPAENASLLSSALEHRCGAAEEIVQCYMRCLGDLA